jgi:four helix bundle protein
VREYANFVFIARGSTSELDTLLELAVRLRYVAASDVAPAQSLVGEVGKMLTVLGKRLRDATV